MNKYKYNIISQAKAQMLIVAKVTIIHDLNETKKIIVEDKVDSEWPLN